MSKARELIDKLERLDAASRDDAIIRVIAKLSDDGGYDRLDEGKWVTGRFDRSIRVDQPTHLRGGDPHAHVYGRKGHEIVVVKLDGSASHGSKGTLHKDDADVLRANGFKIRADNIVEWWAVESTALKILFG